MNKGRVTIPTDLDVIQETIELADKWGGLTPYATAMVRIFR